ncbi:MAG: hypothetical protein AB1700_00735 [Bacillota bacterium]|jgi:hypothetical protein
MFWPIRKTRRTEKTANDTDNLKGVLNAKKLHSASRRIAQIKDAPAAKTPGTSILGILTTEDKLVLGGLFACFCPFLMDTAQLLSEAFRYWRSYVNGCNNLMLLKVKEVVGTVSFCWVGLVFFFLAYALFGLRFAERKWNRRFLVVTLLLFLCFAAVSSWLFCVVCKLYPGEEGQALWIAFAPLLTGGAAFIAAWFVHWMTERMFGRDVGGCFCQGGEVPAGDRGDRV